MIKYESEKISLEEIKLPDYSCYYLKTNPFFGIHAASRDRPPVIIDRREEIQAITNAIAQSLKNDKRSSVLIQGEYGSGKSHLLFTFLSEVRQNLLAREGPRAIGAYVTPGSRFLDFYSNLIDDISLQFLQSAVRHLENEIGSKDRTSFVKALEKEGVGPEFARAISYLTYKNLYATTWRWLMAQRLSATDRATIEVSSNLDTDERALTAYEDLRRTLRKAGYQVICIFFDELEKICEGSQLSRARYFDNVRHLIDRDPGGLCIITTITPTAATILLDEGQALHRRLVMNELRTFKPFENEDAIALIGTYLRIEREQYIGEGQREKELEELIEKLGKDNIDQWTFPFGYDAIREINEQAAGRVSQILRFASTLIEMGVLEKKTYITAEDVKEVLVR